MDKEQLLKNLATGIGKATLWAARRAGEATAKAAEFVYDHREEIAKGGCIWADGRSLLCWDGAVCRYPGADS